MIIKHFAGKNQTLPLPVLISLIPADLKQTNHKDHEGKNSSNADQRKPLSRWLGRTVDQ